MTVRRKVCIAKNITAEALATVLNSGTETQLAVETVAKAMMVLGKHAFAEPCIFYGLDVLWEDEFGELGTVFLVSGGMFDDVAGAGADEVLERSKAERAFAVVNFVRGAGESKTPDATAQVSFERSCRTLWRLKDSFRTKSPSAKLTLAVGVDVLTPTAEWVCFSVLPTTTIVTSHS